MLIKLPEQAKHYPNFTVCEISCVVGNGWSEEEGLANFSGLIQPAYSKTRRHSCLIIRKHHREDAAKADIYLKQLFI